MLRREESGLPKGIPPVVGSKMRSFEGHSMRAFCADDVLVEAAQLGDHEAFAELCRRHAHSARQKIFRIVRHHEDADDAMQETLLRAYANLRTFRQSCKFSTWITAIGINAALTILRKRKYLRELDLDASSPEERTLDIADKGPDPERRVANRQMLLILQTELQGLTPQMRKLVISYYGQEHSLKEAADELGLSVSAVKSRLSRGRRSLRLSFEQRGLLNAYL